MSVMALDPTKTAGWESETPIEDSLLRQFITNWVQAAEALGAPLGARTLRRDDLAAVDVGRPAFIINTATLLAPLFPDRVADLMSTLDDFYASSSDIEGGRILLFSPWPTPELRDHGWALAGHLPLMLRPAGGEMPPPPTGLRVSPVRSEDDLRAAEDVTVRSFLLSDIAAQGPGALFHPGLLQDDRIRMWNGWEGDRAVSTAATVVAAGINSIINVATVPEARRRGYGAAVTWPATLADPNLPTLLLASDQGRPVYEHMGYLTLFRFTIWSRPRPGAT